MSNFARDIAPSLPGTLREAARLFARFALHPVDTRLLAAFRIGFGALMLASLATWGVEFDRWFGPEGTLPLDVSRQTVDPDCRTLFEWLPENLAFMRFAFGLLVFHTVALMLGFFPRINAFFVWIWFTSFEYRNYLAVDASDDVFRLLAFALIWLPSGKAWSIHSLWSSGRHKRYVSAWAWRLIQFQMCLIFVSGAMSKAEGESWWNGVGMNNLARLDDYFGRFPVPLFPFETPWMAALMGISVMAMEFFAPFFLWFRETRRAALVLILAFHLALEYSMNLGLFQWIMILGWLSFSRIDDYRLLLRACPWGKGRPRSLASEFAACENSQNEKI